MSLPPSRSHDRVRVRRRRRGRRCGRASPGGEPPPRRRHAGARRGDGDGARDGPDGAATYARRGRLRAHGRRDDERGDARAIDCRTRRHPDRGARAGSGGRRRILPRSRLERLFRDVHSARYHPLRGRPAVSTPARGGAGDERVSKHERRDPTEAHDLDRTARPHGLAGSSLPAPPSYRRYRRPPDRLELPGTAAAVRTIAIVQVAVFDSVNAITGRYPAFRVPFSAPAGASLARRYCGDADVLVKPSDAAVGYYESYTAALRSVADGQAKTDGIAVGEQVATKLIALCAEDGAMAPNTYRPHTTPGVYVPTMFPAVPHWGKRKTWVMTSADQFRPGPPPSLTSDTWKRASPRSRRSRLRTARSARPSRRHRQVLGSDGARRLWPVASSVAICAGRRRRRERAHVRGGRDRHGRRARRRVRQPSNAYNLWRPVTPSATARVMPRDPKLAAVHRHAMHPSTVRHCHRSGASAPCWR